VIENNNCNDGELEHKGKYTLKYGDAEVNNRVYEPHGETIELEELKTSTSKWIHKPQGLKYHDSEGLQHTEPNKHVLYNFDRFIGHGSQRVPDVPKYG